MTINAAYSRRTGMVAAAAAAAPVQRGCSTGLTGVRSRQACLHGTRGMGVNVRAAPLVLRVLARALYGKHGFCVLQDSACKTRLVALFKPHRNKPIRTDPNVRRRDKHALLVCSAHACHTRKMVGWLQFAEMVGWLVQFAEMLPWHHSWLGHGPA